MRLTRRVTALVWAALAILALPAAGQPPTVEVDLEAAVALALARNPALAAVEERLREVAGGVREARAEAFPQLTGRASWAASRNPAFLNSPDFEDIIAQFPGGDFEPSEQRLYSTGVEVSQPLYTFGKISAAVSLAERVVEVTDAQIAAARLEVALDAAEAYYELLAAREALAVGEVQERVRREALGVVEARYELGEATRLELLRSQAALAQVAPTVAGLRGDVEVAVSRLRRVLGTEPGVVVEVRDGNRGSGPAGPRDLPEPPDLASLLRRAESRPELADLALQRDVLAHRQSVIAADGKPQVELDAFLGRQVRELDNVSDPLYDDYSVALGVTWSFFDGGRRKGQIAQLESQRRQLEHRRRDLAAEIHQEVAEALTGYRTAVARWRAAQAAAEASREAARVAREGYQEGVALQADWLDAQRQETETEIEAVEAFYDARQEAARLARAVGVLPGEGLPAGTSAAGEPPGAEESTR
jgi:HAE1 family hydrophobic/amphiphilic exporter-1